MSSQIEGRTLNAGLHRSILFLLSITAATFSIACTSEGGESAENDSASDSEPDAGETDTGFVTEDGTVYPGARWPEQDPESVGFDPDALAEAAQLADEGDSHCLTVVHGGYLIGEWFFDDWDRTTEQNVFSITKSVTSLAVGIAEDEGLLSVDDAASEYIEEWQGTESESVAIRDLLSHTSGRYWDFWNDYLGLGGSEDMTGFAVGLSQQYDPGTVWEYNNSAVQTLERVVTRATDTSLADYTTEHLLSKIGVSSTFSQDRSGNTIAYSDFTASCEDLARLGYLLLRGGRWGDTQVVSKAYLDAAFTPSSSLNDAYGYLFWLNRDGHWIAASKSADEKPSGDGKMHKNLPEDMIIAEGLQNQLIVILPSDDLVITRIGGEGNAVAAFTSGNLSDPVFLETLIADILAAGQS